MFLCEYPYLAECQQGQDQSHGNEGKAYKENDFVDGPRVRQTTKVDYKINYAGD